MKDSKKQAYINTISKVQPKHTRKFLEELSDRQLSTLYKKCNKLPSIVRTQPKDVKPFRRKLFKNKDILFKDIGAISSIREQDNHSFELEVSISCTKFASEVKSLMGYDANAYVRKVLNTLFSNDFHYDVHAELDVNNTGFWYWNKWDEKESESFMYLVVVITDLSFTTVEKSVFTGEFYAPFFSDYYNNFYYALWVELNNGRCGYISEHIIDNNRASVRFATRIDDVRRLRVYKEQPSYSDFFSSDYSDFKYIKKAELVLFKYKHISKRIEVVNKTTQEVAI